MSDIHALKIALVSTYMPPHPGGIEHVALNLFKGYQRAGHEVRWLTSRIPRSEPRREGPIVRVPCLNVVEDRLGIPLPVWGPTALRELREMTAWADVVHVVEALYLPSAMAVAVAKRAGKPVLLCQNVGFVPYPWRVLEWLEHLAYATLGKAVLLSASHLVLATPTADQFVRSLLGTRLRSASTFPVGIDTDMFHPASPGERAAARSALGIPAGRRAVLFAGRLVEKKGVPVALGTAERLPGVSFVIAGDGPLRGLMKSAPANVRWLGHVDAARMAQLYSAVDAVLLPSRGEGLPLFVQEAMSCGLPAVISSDEVYAAGLLEAGVCYGASRDAEAMARSLSEALETSTGRRERARRYAVERWALAPMVERYVSIMGELLRGGSPPVRDIQA